MKLIRYQTGLSPISFLLIQKDTLHVFKHHCNDKETPIYIQIADMLPEENKVQVLGSTYKRNFDSECAFTPRYNVHFQKYWNNLKGQVSSTPCNLIQNT